MGGKNLYKVWITTALAAFCIGCGVGAQPPTVAADSSPSQQLPFSGGKSSVIAANTAIYIRLQQTLSSTRAQLGDSFNAVLDEPLMVEGQTLVPAGTPVTGKVVAVRNSGHMNHASYLRITLSSITLNGKSVPLQTNSVFVSGGSYRRHSLAFTGGGAGSGALLSTLVGANKGTDQSALSEPREPAAYATGKKEVGFMAERRLSFRLTQPFDAI